MLVIAVDGIGEVSPGDDIAELISTALTDGLEPGDIVVVTHKVVSKAEGAIDRFSTEEERRAIIEGQAAEVLRRRGDLLISVTRHGFVCANAGVDQSNTEPGTVVLLPTDPDRSARRIQAKLEHRWQVPVGVVITDTFGRPWRRGLTDVAIGVAGIPAIEDHRGRLDTHGNVLEVTEVAVADEIAAAADLVMGKATGTPVAIVRGLRFASPGGSGRDLIRPPGEDLFR